MLIHILEILFRNSAMNEDLSGKDWTYFLNFTRQIVKKLHQSLKQSEELSLPIDESRACRLYIWLITNLFQERLFRNLQMKPDNIDEKLHKTINEIVKSFEIYDNEENDDNDIDLADTLNPSSKSLKGRTWQERNEWAQLWINTGIYLLEGNNATNENAIYREIRYCPYPKLLTAWITEIWIYGFSIIDYLAITLHYIDRFFNEEDVVEAIKLSQVNLGILDNKLLNDWKFVKNRMDN